MTEKEYSTAEELDFVKIPPYPRQIASYFPQIMRDCCLKPDSPSLRILSRSSTMIDKLTSDELILQRYSLGDADDLLSAIKQSYNEISPWMSWLTLDYDLIAAKEFIILQMNNWSENLEYTFAIRDKQGTFLGTIGLHIYDKLNGVASIGYWMNTQYCCRGYCTQAVKSLVENTMKSLNLIRIEIIVATQNQASQRVAIKSGAKFEAVLKNRIKLHGKAIDANMNAIYSKI